MRIILLVFSFASLVLISCDNSSTKWNGWRGANRDGVVAGFNSPETWPAELKQVWAQNVGLCDASPVLVNKRLYLHVNQDGNEVTLCIDAETGAEVWRTINNVAPEVTGGPRNHPGPRSTPFVTNGKVYTLGVGGTLTCLNAKTGEVVWANSDYSEVPEFYAAMSPLVEDEKCFVHLGGRESGTVAAFDASTGEKLWEIKGHPSTYSSPVIMKAGKEKILVVQTETDLLGISMNGNLLWEIPTPAERRFYNASTPVIIGQNIILAGQGMGTRSLKVELSEKGYTLTEKWINPDFGVSFNTLLLKNGHLYGHEARLGKLFCLDAETGKTCWSDTIAYNRFASNLDLGNEILSLTANGNMIIYEPNPERYVEKAKYNVSGNEVYAHPVIAGNRIFTKEQEKIICWQVN